MKRKPSACPSCQGTRAKECPNHPKYPACVTEQARAEAVCSSCKDLGYLPCPTCRSANSTTEHWKEVQESWVREHAMARNVLDQLVKLRGGLKPEFKYDVYVTPHMALASDLPQAQALECVMLAQNLVRKVKSAFPDSHFVLMNPQGPRAFLLKDAV